MSQPASQQIKGTVQAIRMALQGTNVSEIRCAFDGSGDSGTVEYPTYHEKNGDEVEVDDEDQLCPTDEDADPGSEPGSLREVIHGLCYQVLENKHGGWEINEGSYGDISIDLDNRLIQIEMNTRYTESDYSSEEIDLED